MALLIAQLPYLRSMALIDDKGLILASTQAGEAGQQINTQDLLHDKAAVLIPGKPQLGRLVPGRSLSSLAPRAHPTPRGVSFLPQLLAFHQDNGMPAVLVWP